LRGLGSVDVARGSGLGRRVRSRVRDPLLQAARRPHAGGVDVTPRRALRGDAPPASRVVRATARELAELDRTLATQAPTTARRPGAAALALQPAAPDPPRRRSDATAQGPPAAPGNGIANRGVDAGRADVAVPDAMG